MHVSISFCLWVWQCALVQFLYLHFGTFRVVSRQELFQESSTTTIMRRASSCVLNATGHEVQSTTIRLSFCSQMLILVGDHKQLGFAQMSVADERVSPRTFRRFSRKQKTKSIPYTLLSISTSCKETTPLKRSNKAVKAPGGEWCK